MTRFLSHQEIGSWCDNCGCLGLCHLIGQGSTEAGPCSDGCDCKSFVSEHCQVVLNHCGHGVFASDYPCKKCQVAAVAPAEDESDEVLVCRQCSRLGVYMTGLCDECEGAFQGQVNAIQPDRLPPEWSLADRARYAGMSLADYERMLGE